MNEAAGRRDAGGVQNEKQVRAGRGDVAVGGRRDVDAARKAAGDRQLDIALAGVSVVGHGARPHQGNRIDAAGLGRVDVDGGSVGGAGRQGVDGGPGSARQIRGGEDFEMALIASRSSPEG